jgi:hypothetical protein
MFLNIHYLCCAAGELRLQSLRPMVTITTLVDLKLSSRRKPYKASKPCGL